MKLNGLIAGCMGLIGFAVAIFGGIEANNELATILKHAVVASIGCCVIGYIAGWIGSSVAVEHAAKLAVEQAKKDEAARLARQKEDAERAARMAAAS